VRPRDLGRVALARGRRGRRRRARRQGSDDHARERRLPRASLHHIPDAGHLLALDQPAAVARLVAEHLGT
jgi:pimeloyl-ACP methyl ester carboxylesterase